ncbi:MAG TPA: hypothetical protein VGQ26_27060 [Streptosporangiaceae bacterium]|jgi:hypothetical protein|nr:hypothetical protein [Streptosporangiaceae bacterium]
MVRPAPPQTQSSIAGKNSIEIMHSDDGSDAFEYHLSHAKKR